LSIKVKSKVKGQLKVKSLKLKVESKPKFKIQSDKSALRASKKLTADEYLPMAEAEHPRGG